MKASTYSLSFRVWHPRMTSADISAKLGMTPRYRNDAGSPRTRPDGSPLTGTDGLPLSSVHKETSCSFDIAKGNFLALEKELSAAIGRLQAVKAGLASILSSGGRAEFLFGFFLEGNEGFILALDQLKIISDLGISLSFDLYGGS